MAWWLWLLAWFVVSVIAAPAIGAWLRRIARHYPPVNDD